MLVLRTRDDLFAARAAMPGPVGLTPTMGALHAGHVALVTAAQARCASVVATIFVNPTQFTDPAAAAAYPRDEEADFRKLADAGCTAVWAPDVTALYPPGDATMVDPAGPALLWEGTHRPGHFRGMATVVAKLFGLVRPDAAYFGEKDWQQLQVVRRMVADLLLPLDIVGVPTVREPDGLAMSSRNRFLSPAQRALAPLIYRVLTAIAGGLPVADGERRLADAGFGVNYLARVAGETLTPDPAGNRLIVAAQLGTVRLLDNIPA